ncbi:TlpA disulfide reductase family protein [Mucilaginibacter sp.]|jgi:thiol-disulfide isomerase/thioredoxin|uniref:TlpA disulfide reductase family protein n=1 Tax=Mucilaginibacter sp. TaxID=1882438 RepID=UPI002B55DA01|nr:TlpA disulfide reductase family protein [Mucilaginibacter sp.]HTI59729.1 TlpA disulfide reductase family protein [Mucilaginibacter sp.]
MKKLIAAAVALAPLMALAQDGAYTIEGKIGNYNAPAKVYLDYMVKDKEVRDSVVLKDGRFQFKGTIGATPINAYLALNDKGTGLIFKDYKAIYLEKGDINVNSATKLADAKVDGPKANQDNAKYEVMTKAFDADQDALDAKIKAETPEQKDSEAYQREIAAAQKAIDDKQMNAHKTFVQQNPGSYISIMALEMYSAYGADYADIAPLYEGLTPEIKGTDQGKEFGERLPKLKAVALGATAPLFAEADTAGKTVSLESFRGKYVLVDFWASWCGPCRRENPNVVKGYNKYKGKNFTIVGVSLDGPRGKIDLAKAKQSWLDAIHKDKLTWTQVSDLKFWKSKEADLYAVRGIPANFLIDPNGKIIAKSLHGFELQDKLAEIFGKAETAGGSK